MTEDTHKSTIKQSAESYAHGARSKRTRAAYEAQWEAFAAWCSGLGLEALPAAPDSVASYLADRIGDGRKVSTLAQALSAISQRHQEAGYASPRASLVVRETFKGIRRAHGCAPAQKAPLFGSQFRALLSALPATSRGARDRALLLVGFAGAFRRSELVSIDMADLAFDADGLTVTLRRSKTDQEGRGRRVGVPYADTLGVCPVRALQAWLALAPATSGPVFRAIDRHGNVGGRLGAGEVARVVKRACSAAMIDPKAFAGHSLRSGLVTAAAKAGRDVSAIMKQTGHSSVAMVQRYIRDASLFDRNAAKDLL